MSLSPQVPHDFEGASAARTSWQRYVHTLCTQAWDFDDAQTEALLDRLEELVLARRVTDGFVVSALLDSGVTEASAMMIAPSIRVSILS